MFQPKLKIKKPKRKKRPEEVFLEFLSKASKANQSKKIQEQLNKAPDYVVDLVFCLTHPYNIPSDWMFKRVGRGTFKTVFSLKGEAVSIEFEKNRNRDKELYGRLTKVTGCPNIMYPSTTFYYFKFKFNRMPFCVEGDFRDVAAQVPDKIPIGLVLNLIHNLGFSLRQLHMHGVYPTDIKPENILYCSCGPKGKKYLVFSDLEDCPMESDFIGNKLGDFQRETSLQKRGFLTQTGRETFPSTPGYNLLSAYQANRLSITKEELMFEGWYALAHVFLEMYSYVTSNRSKNSERRVKMYEGRYGFDWRRPAHIDQMDFLGDYLAYKMFLIIDSGTNYLLDVNQMMAIRGYNLTLTGRVIDTDSWIEHFKKVIVKDFSAQTRRTWHKILQKEYEAFRKANMKS